MFCCSRWINSANNSDQHISLYFQNNLYCKYISSCFRSIFTYCLSTRFRCATASQCFTLVSSTDNVFICPVHFKINFTSQQSINDIIIIVRESRLTCRYTEENNGFQNCKRQIDLFLIDDCCVRLLFRKTSLVTACMCH